MRKEACRITGGPHVLKANHDVFSEAFSDVCGMAGNDVGGVAPAAMKLLEL